MKQAAELPKNHLDFLSPPLSSASSKEIFSEEKGEEKANEKSLWKAVIMQSVLDIMNTSSRTENIIARKDAIYWFNINNPDFILVCEYADLNPQWVLKKVRFALQNPHTWRRPCDLRKFIFTAVGI